MKLVLDYEEIKQSVKRDLERRGYVVDKIRIYWWPNNIDPPHIEATIKQP